MPSLTGYIPGPQLSGVMTDIFGKAPLNLSRPAEQLAKEFFTCNFMAYARTKWIYEASSCNCEHLAHAFSDAWHCLRTHPCKNRMDLPKGEVARCPKYDGMITKALPVLGGVAKGNVRAQTTRALDGRCLFPTHWVCKIGSCFFDPTFNLVYRDEKWIVQHAIKRLAPGLWHSQNPPFLYALNTSNKAQNFNDSWVEMNPRGWISSQKWMEKTPRWYLSRSQDLKKVDAALVEFETKGADALPDLKLAFTNWCARNRPEVNARNFEGCITGLASFLGVPLRP